MKRKRIQLVNPRALVIGLLAAGLIPLHAANRTWTGAGGDRKWSTPANWGGTAPANGDVLIFNGTTSQANTNDLINSSFAGVRFQTGGFQLYGNPLILTTTAAGLVTNLAGLNTIYFNVSSLQSAKAWYVAPGAEIVLANTNNSTGTGGGIVMLDGGGTVRITGSLTAIRGMDVTNGTVIVDGAYADHSNDGFRFKSRAGATASARLINNGTWRWGGGANFRLGNLSAAGTNLMSLESGTLELYGSATSIYVGDTAAAGSSSVFTQTGGQVLSTGSGNTDLYMGTSSGAESIYSLDGGTLMIRRIRANSPGQGVFNFNGGTLIAKNNDGAFLQDIAAAYIKAGGALIDSSTFTVTIGQALVEDAASPGGGLTKLGSGTLNLTGISSYQGATKLGSGTLGVGAVGYPNASTLVMSNSTVLRLDAAGGGSSLATPSLTLGDNTTLYVSYGALAGNPSAAAISDASALGTALNVRGTNIVLNISGSGFVAGQFPLVKYSGGIGGNGFGAFVLGTLPPGVLGQLVHNTTSGSIDLNITLVVNALSWNGNLNADWDLNTTANWKDPLLAAITYKEYGTTNIVGDIVTFDDSLTNDLVNPQNTNVILTTTLRPAIVNFSSSFTPYSLGGPGKLSGSCQLNVSGSGSLKISTANDHSGGSTLAAGTEMLLLANDFALGTGPIVLNGGTFSADGATPRVLTNSTTITAATFGTDLAAGALTFSGPVSFGGAGRMVSLNSGVTFTGTVTNGGVERKIGPGTLTYSGVTGRETQGSWQIEDGEILVTGGNLEKGNGGLRVMATTPGGLSRYVQNGGVITMSGNGQNLRVGSGSPPGDVSATNIATLAGVLTWTSNNVSGQVQMGANCAFAQLNLLAGGLLRVGAFAAQGTNNMELNLDGGTLAPMASRSDYLQGLTWANVRDGGLTVDTEGLNITIGQSLLAAGTGGLKKNGLGALTLTGTNTYTGTTVVNGGTLILGPAHAAAGLTTIADGAELGFLSDAGGVTVGLGSATVGSVSGASLMARFAGLGNPTAPAGHVTNLTLNGLTPVSVSLAGISVGTIPLLRYTTLGGSGTLSNGSFPQGVVGTVTNNLATKTIELVVSSVTPLVWTGAGTTIWDIGTSTNWHLGGMAAAFQDGDGVRLDDSALSSVVVITQIVSPGSVLFNNNAFAYSVSTSSGGKLSGGTSLTKDGTNIVTLGGANDFTGEVNIKAGTLAAGNASALGSAAGGTIIRSGATLDVKGFNLGAEPVTVQGAGVDGLGAIYSSGGAQNNALRFVTLTGDVVFGGPGRWDVRGNPTGSLLTGGNAYNLTKVGANQVSVVNATVDPALADIDVQEGVFSYEAGTPGLGNPARTLTIRSNAVVLFWNATNALDKKVVMEAGSRIRVGAGIDPLNTVTGPITLTDGTATFQVNSGVAMTVNGPIGGNGSLEKANPGILTLEGANTYLGTTVISNGTLALAAGAAIATSPDIFVNTNSTLDVSAVTPWTLAASQTLSGGGAINGSVTANGTVSPGASIATLTFAHDLTLAGTTVMEITKDGGLTNDVISVSGGLTYGGVLKVLVTGVAPLAVNDSFKLFSFASAPFGSFSQLSLPTDYTWDTTQLSADGSVRVTGLAAPPTLSVAQVGNNLQFTWTGPFKLQAQTNGLSAGFSTNWFDYPGGGSSGVTVPIDAANGTVFFRLSQ